MGKGAMHLLADVGGTNTRLALACAEGIEGTSIASFRNDSFDSFDDLLARYLDQIRPGHLMACCIALAGPVTATTARLTNRNWVLDRARIAAGLDGAQVFLINDLSALGYALPRLGAAQMMALRPGGVDRRLNGQAIVAGFGTGFNICLTRRDAAGGVIALEAEAGHSSLPSSVAIPLVAALGQDGTAGFRSVEDCFSGRGLSRVYGVLSDAGPGARDAQDIIAGYGDAGPARASIDLMARLMGIWVMELIHLYLPFEGVFLAGGVARGVLGLPARSGFLDAVNAPVGDRKSVV